MIKNSYFALAEMWSGFSAAEVLTRCTKTTILGVAKLLDLDVDPRDKKHDLVEEISFEFELLRGNLLV